jgi:iron complex outermembrane recepter protein
MISQLVASLIRRRSAVAASRLTGTLGAAALCIVGLSAVGPALAQAQQAAPPSAANTASEGPLEEVTVTARFRSERLQETPLAITAISADTLTARGQTDVTQLAQFVPNAVINPLGAGWGSTIAASIRGIGLSDNSLSFEPGVPIYLDGVYLGRPQGAILDLLDLDHVEVLRGPQGTLFGKNAIGGTVSLISKQPTGDGHGHAEVEFGAYNRRYFRGSWDVSVVPDQLFARVSFSSKRRDGYMDVLDYECVNGPGSLGNGGTGIPGVQAPIRLGSQVTATDTRGCVADHQGDENVQSARVALRWLATDKLDITTTGDYTTQNQEGPPDQYTQIFTTPGSLAGFWNDIVGVPVFGIPWDARFLPTHNYTNYDGYSDPVTGHVFPNVNDLTEYGLSNVITWTLTPGVTLKAITAGRRFSNSFGRNSSGSPLPLNYTWDTSNHHQFSEEVTLTGTADKLEWTIGGFYYDGTDSNQGFSSLYYLVPFLAAASFDDYDIQTTKDYAGFVHAVYHISDKLSTELGVRYTHDAKHAVIFRQDFAGDVTIPHTPVDVDTSKVSPKVGLDYQFSADVLGYIQYSTGFRGGGFGPRPGDAFQVRSFKPEDLKTGEVGLKSEWLNHRLRWNSAIFYSKYTNLQQGFNTTDPFGQPWFSTINVGASKIYGIEAEVLAQATDALQLQASFGYQKYEVTDVGNLAGTLCFTHANGDDCVPPRTPKYTGSGSAQYVWPVGSSGATVTLRGDATYQSPVYFTDLTFTAVPGQGGYALYNARLTWDSPGKEWSVAAFGTNLANKFYWQGKLTLQVLGFEEGNPGPPRMWGINLRRNF